VSEEPIAVTELYATLNALQHLASSVDINVDPHLERVLDGVALSSSLRV
jgi:type VI protein secretion system component VasA